MRAFSFLSPSRFRKAIAPVGHVDAFAGGRVTGWAMAPGGVRIEAWLNGECMGRCRPSLTRLDVATAYPRQAAAEKSGFALDLPDAAMRPDMLGELHILARTALSRWPVTTIGSFQVAGEAVIKTLAHAGDSSIVGPFPRQVIDAIAAGWPEDCVDLHSAAGQRRFAARLRRVMATPGLNALPAVADYARYLTVTLAHCAFVERHFPTTNDRAVAGASDYHCKPNSVREIFAIIHQLYVLKSWGIQGDFAEFGCFKGYSSAMLSFACRQLGLHMHIFDSFEGLPSAEGSGYQAGQYAGSLPEVRDHVTRFGAVEAVEFHPGFFADTFRNWRPPPLMCLWMDVDLEVSARDLMVVADRLDPRAGLFSHECTADIFQEEGIVTQPRPDNPVTPMLDRHAELGRPLTGRYVSGYTGAFWPRNGGIPVIDNDVLMEIALFS
jgi:O-methyltransferase